MSDIAEQLAQKLGARVGVRMRGGASATLIVLNVDEEGCTCRVLDNTDYNPNTEYWWSFDEIDSVEAN